MTFSSENYAVNPNSHSLIKLSKKIIIQKEGDHYYRNSMIYREKVDRITEQILEKELILKNHSKVMYDPKLIPTELIKQ